MVERSRRPKHSPNQIPKGLEGQIVKLRRQTGFSAQRLQHEFLLPCRHNTIARASTQNTDVYVLPLCRRRLRFMNIPKAYRKRETMHE